MGTLVLALSSPQLVALYVSVCAAIVLAVGIALLR